VSLPAGVFKPYSGVKTSILLLDKKLARQTQEILFLKITADGFDLGDKRNPIEANDLPEAERVVKLWFTGKLNEKVETPLAWRAVEKKSLLEHRAVSLQAEPFFGDKATASDIECVSLSDVCEFIDYRGKTPEKSDKGVPLITAKNVRWGMVNKEPAEFVTEETYTKHMTRGFPKRGDVLFTTEAPLGMAALIDTDERFALAQRIICFSPNPERLVGGYLVQALLSKKVQDAIHSFASGATAQGIKASSLKEIEIPLPPLEEQRRIVAEIEGYQKVLDGARQILAGYQPDLEIDHEWEMTPLGEIADVKLGKMLDKTKHRAGRLMPYLRNVNVRWGSIETHDLLEMYFEADEMERFGLAAGDVLVCEGGEPGRAAVWDGRMPDLKYQKALHRVRFKIPYEPKLLVYFLQALAKTKEWEDRFHGATIKHFTREMFIELPIPLPPLPEQRRLVAELDAEAAQMDSVRSLLPRFEAKIQRVLDRVWGKDVVLASGERECQSSEVT
ncbi:MAG: restriction endonuclease subunit S, partial [Limisphaerales bacterium]